MAARASDSDLMALMRTIDAGDRDAAARLLAASPALARACLASGATRQDADGYFLDRIGKHVYAGDTALHVAAAAHWKDFATKLVAAGADLRARNRRGAEPLHAAAVGGPGSAIWDPRAQAATIAWLIGAGADPNAVDMDGVTPLHRAVRTRCAAAVAALLEGRRRCRAQERQRLDAAAARKIDHRARRLRLAGREGAATEIVRLLARHGARR